MDLADEFVDESPFRMHVGSSFGGISAPVTSNNGNPFSLFYSPASAIQHNNVIQSSRASNSWIASLRSNKQRSYSPVISALDGRQHHYEQKRDGAGNNGRSTSIDGGLSSSSRSLSSSFRHWGSLESMQRNQRLKQLAAQSTTKVRSLTARESTAAAERWRYIQTVLERRRKESLEQRERFIRQPLDNILRQKGTTSIKQSVPPAWDSFVAGRSIMKRRTQNWRMKARRHVHFDVNQQNETTEYCHEESNREKLPFIPIPEETEATSNEGSFVVEEDQRLPPLMTPSPTMEIITDPQGSNDTPQRVSTSGPSWVERQVAKVRQRKLWAFRQQQQQQQEKLNHHPPRAILKRSVSLLVNVPDERDTETDSLNEEEGEAGDRSEVEEQEEEDVISSRNAQSLAWEVVLDKDELAEMSNEQIKDETTVDSYGGWPHFPAKLAICIQQRQKSLKEREAGRKEETRNEGKLNHHNHNSFVRRMRFGKRLSIAVVRQRKRKTHTKRVLSSVHQPQAIQRSSKLQHENEEESDAAAVLSKPIADHDVDQCLTNAISSLQMLDTTNLLPIHADVVSEISSTPKSNEIHTIASTPSPSSPSDLISEADVTQQPEDASVSPAESSDAETIVADAQYHLDGLYLIPAADGDLPMTKNDENYYPKTAGSTFCPVSVCKLREEIADESISDVTVDDGACDIDQQESNVTTIPQKQNDGMACYSADAIPAPPGISSVEQTEYHISPPVHSSAIDNKDSAIRGRRLPAYCSGWPIVISNQNGDAIPPSTPPALTTVSYWNNFEAPTSEETMTGTINHPDVDISSEATAFARPILSTQKDSNHPPPVSPVIIQTLLDKKTKEARNASRILFPTVMSIRTQTEPQPSRGSKDDGKAEEEKTSSDPMMEEGAKELEETADCQCLHRAVLTCLLPEAAETLANLELIRRQLKKARVRRQGSERQRQPLQVRRNILSDIDPANSSTTN